MKVLYQFETSPFCEQARWALDYKGLPYRTVTLVPGFHQATLKKLPTDILAVPTLVNDHDVVVGAGTILDYLDKHDRQPTLTPVSTQDAAIAHEWERYARTNLGLPLCGYYYCYALQSAVIARRHFIRNASWWPRLLSQFAYPVFRRRVAAAIGIDDGSAARLAKTVAVAFDQFEQALTEHRFLAGPIFSRADLTVSALLRLLWHDDHGLSEQARDLCAQLRARPLGQWAQAIYDQYR